MAGIKEVNLKAGRGDSFIKLINFTDSNGAAIDITDWKIYFTIKQNESDSDDNAKIKKDITSHYDAVNGKTKINIAGSELNDLSGKYYYDIQFKKADGEIKTLMKGTITFEVDITTRTT